MSRRAPRNQVLVGDALTRLQQLPAGSVDCIVTSPPYFALRNYGAPGQFGAEASVEQWVEKLRVVFAEAGRVLSPRGTLWLNLGDAFSRGQRWGAPAKSLLLGPERLLLALAADGWTVRNKIVWAKRNPKPSSARDRLTLTWEPIYLLVRFQRYAFDLDAIRMPHRSRSAAARGPTRPQARPAWAGPLAGTDAGLPAVKARGAVGHPLGKNPGDVWALASSHYRGAHFATFPEALVEPCLRAGCPALVCARCDQPWQRPPLIRRLGHLAVMRELTPACACRAKARPGLVLDPFMGAGTVAVVAERLGRDWLGIELNPDFVALTKQRLSAARRRAI